MNPVPTELHSLPRPHLPSRPELERLTAVAWEQALEHIAYRDGVPSSPYMDEAFEPDTLWIWDTCLMALYCAHAPDVFPGIQSLDNFYGPLHLGVSSAQTIHHADNPPLFAWAEWEYLCHTGDLGRIERVLDSRVLETHFEWFERVPVGTIPAGTRRPTSIERTPHGYRWSGVCSGMDNTPRAPQGDAHGTFGPVLWLDAMAQQALSALCIGRLNRALGREDEAQRWDEKHRALVEWLNQQHWSAEAACYLDRVDEGERPFSPVVTPAIFWPVLAEASSPEQVDALATRVEDPDGLGGVVPWPSVERRDPAFSPAGHYWRGGVWVPVAYMAARALADHGHEKLAHRTTEALLTHMSRCLEEFTPGTIWEAYSPTSAAPSTAKDDVELVRPNFCGWSALGPVAMMFEHVLGFRVDALARQVRWTRHLNVEHGISHLRCGDVRVSVTTEADHGLVRGDCDGAFTLVLDGVAHEVEAGEFSISA